MKLNHFKKIIFFCFFLFCAYAFQSCTAFAQEIISELTNIQAEKDTLLISIAKRYPEVKFSQLQNPDKLVIELLNTDLHKTFEFNNDAKNALLIELNFVEDILINSLKDENNTNKTEISILLREGARLKPKILSTRENIVRIALNLEENEEQIKISKEKEISDLYNKAVEEQTNRNLDKAEELYKEIISKDGAFYLAKYNLSKIYLDKKMFDESINILCSIIKEIQKSQINPSTLITIRNTLGTAYYLKDDLDEAYDQFIEIINLKPDFYPAYFNIGLINEKTKNIKQAKLSFQKTLEMKPDYGEAYYHLGILNLITKDKKKAITNFKKVIELEPKNRFAKLSENELEKLNEKGFVKSK